VSGSGPKFIVVFHAGGSAGGAAAQAPVAGVLQRAVEKSCAAPAALPEAPEPQEHWLAVARSPENRLPVRHQAMRPNLPSAQWRLARYRHLPHPHFRDFLRRRDKPLI